MLEHVAWSGHCVKQAHFGTQLCSSSHAKLGGQQMLASFCVVKHRDGAHIHNRFVLPGAPQFPDRPNPEPQILTLNPKSDWHHPAGDAIMIVDGPCGEGGASS